MWPVFPDAPSLKSSAWRLVAGRFQCYFARMSTLAEIERAAEALPPEQKEELFLFLVTRLRGETAGLPPPREFSRDQMEQWLREDEAGYRRVLAGQ